MRIWAKKNKAKTNPIEPNLDSTELAAQAESCHFSMDLVI